MRLWSRIHRFFRDRFGDVSRSEAWGYWVWGAMGIVVAVPELWAAVGGDDFPWPTISSTVGHLENRTDWIAVIPVAALAAAAYLVIRYKPLELVVQADENALTRTREGRLAQAGAPGPALLEEPRAAELIQAERRQWPALPYFAIATVAVIGGSLVASRSDNKYLLGYVLYSLIAAFWIVIPNAVAYFRRTDVPFTTLLFTIRCLDRRLHFVAALVVAGLAVLLVHLALYPWPDLARESTKYAGLTGGEAQTRAEAALPPGSDLRVRSQARGRFDGLAAWIVYFERPTSFGSGCVVAVTRTSVTTSPEC